MLNANMMQGEQSTQPAAGFVLLKHSFPLIFELIKSGWSNAKHRIASLSGFFFILKRNLALLLLKVPQRLMMQSRLFAAFIRLVIQNFLKMYLQLNIIEQRYW
jgi:hypothetical protein